MKRTPQLFLIAAVVGLSACSQITPVGVGTTAPDFSAVDLSTGDSVSFLDDYRGQVTLVNIWATWCGPCEKEIPALDSLARALGPLGLRIAAVSIDVSDSSVVSEWIAKYDVAFDVLHDQAGSIQQSYQTTGVPESYLVDRDGQIVRIIYSAHPWTSPANRRIVERLLDNGGATE